MNQKQFNAFRELDYELNSRGSTRSLRVEEVVLVDWVTSYYMILPDGRIVWVDKAMSDPLEIGDDADSLKEEITPEELLGNMFGMMTSIKVTQKEFDKFAKDEVLVMARDYISIGSSPCEEECAQLEQIDYNKKSLEECQRYIKLIRTKLGEEPYGALLKSKTFQHDFGNYREVVCYYDDKDPESVKYAFACESNGPQTWDDNDPFDWRKE